MCSVAAAPPALLLVACPHGTCHYGNADVCLSVRPRLQIPLHAAGRFRSNAKPVCAFLQDHPQTAGERVLGRQVRLPQRELLTGALESVASSLQEHDDNISLVVCNRHVNCRGLFGLLQAFCHRDVPA
jgi:hypothetical protein